MHTQEPPTCSSSLPEGLWTHSSFQKTEWRGAQFRPLNTPKLLSTERRCGPCYGLLESWTSMRSSKTRSLGLSSLLSWVEDDAVFHDLRR